MPLKGWRQEKQKIWDFIKVVLILAENGAVRAGRRRSGESWCASSGRGQQGWWRMKDCMGI